MSLLHSKCLLVLLICSLVTTAASAETIQVDTLIDDETLNGNCTLREAVNAANNDLSADACTAGDGDDTILLPSGTIVLNGPILRLTNNVSVEGVSETDSTIDGGTVRTFVVSASGSAVLRDLTITSGGGGLGNEGTLTLERVTIRDCAASPDGGGILNSGTLMLESSTLRDNTASADGGEARGGGIYNNGMLTLLDTTFEDNRAAGASGGFGSGGGLFNDVAGDTAGFGVTWSNNTTEADSFLGLSPTGGGLCNHGLLVLETSTFSNNHRMGNGITRADDITNQSAAANRLIHVTVSNDGAGEAVTNSSSLQAVNSLIDGSCLGGLTSAGGNLESTGDTCGFDQASDQTGISTSDLALQTLASSSGPTATHPLAAGSSAIDRALNASCDPVDQRGLARPEDGDGDSTATCDIGAVEAQPSRITIMHNAEPDDPQDITYSGGLGSFTLDDDDDPTLPNHRTFEVSPGTFTIIENPAPGWVLETIACTCLVSGDDCGATVDLPSRSVTLTVPFDEQAECTFSSRPNSFITIVKATIPESPQDFAFSGDLGNFLLDNDPGDGLLADRQTFDLPAGTYGVTESTVPDWILTDLVCNDPDGGTAISMATRTATIDLDPGEDITCTFTNSQQGTINIAVDAIPNAPQVFDFSGDLGNFSLDDDQASPMPSSNAFQQIPGSYSVTGTVPSGWVLDSLTCSDPDDESTVAPGTATATVDLDPGEDITCTFTLILLGTVTIIHDALPDDGQDFDFSGGLGAFVLDDDENGTLSSSRTFEVMADVYVVSENLPEGWTLTELSCSDPSGGSTVSPGSQTATIDLDPGEDVICTFVNAKDGTLTIHHDSLPDGPQDFVLTGDLGNFSLDDDPESTDISGSRIFTLPPGSYSITELAPPGWGVLGGFCVDPDGGTLAVDGNPKVVVDLDPGESVSCTFAAAVPFFADGFESEDTGAWTLTVP